MANESSSKLVVWILVDHSAQAESFQSVAHHLRQTGDVEPEIVTITEVFGNVARGAIAGGAERLLRGLRVALQGRNDEDLVGAVRRARPDLLVVTDPRYVRALGLLESLSGIESLQVGVLPDFNLAPDWRKSPVQGFVVPHESFRQLLVDSGYPQERVRVAGPPVQERFSLDVDRGEARKSFGFGEESIVFVRANGFDAAMLDKIVFQSTLVDRDARFVFHHDGDQGTASGLRQISKHYGLRALMFGKVDDLQRYVAACDLVVAAPNDPYVAEIVSVDRPLLFVGDEGDHAAQVDFLVEHDAARHVADVLRLGVEVDRTLADETLEQMATAAAALSTTAGSKDVAQALEFALENRAEWSSTPEVEPPAPQDDAPPESKGAFEVIGDSGTDSEQAPKDSSGAEKGASKQAPLKGLSKSQAKEQLAALIMLERDLERRLDEAERQQNRWRNRLELAREWNEADLAEEAEAILRDAMADAEKLGGELKDVHRQKAKLKAAAGAGDPTSGADSKRTTEMEGRFRKMEVDNDLEALKDRIRRELGE